MTKDDFWKIRLKEWVVLDKPARISEILFGLIMVLTFTGTISVSTAGRKEVGELLWAALALLFAGGFALARYSQLRPVITALVYTAIGVFLVAMTMALGG